jgi:very-short-patch-repair endonuclease
VEIARRLRRNLSPPEAQLWNRLRARAPQAPIFRRQHPIGPDARDFFREAVRSWDEKRRGSGAPISSRPSKK